MAIYSSVDTVLAAISYKVKVYNDVLKDPVCKQILGTSPPVARKQYLSRSLDIAETRMAAASSAKDAEKQQENEKKLKAAAQDEALKASVRVIKFEKGSGGGGDFVFEESPVAPNPAPPPSLLAELIKSTPIKSKADEGMSRAERVTVRVFLPEGHMSVEVPKVATVGELIWSTIQQYEEDNRSPALVRQTRAYLLKMAEEDGSQEDMVLKYTDKFFNFGLFFALVPNPAYEAGAAALGLSGGKDSPGNRSTLVASADRGTIRDKQKASLRKGTVGRTKKVTSADFGKDDIIENELLKIKMPDGSHTTVRLPDSAPATEVLEKCCSKRKFDPDRYHLEFIDDGENVPDATTVLQLKEKAIELVANSEIAGLDTYMSDRKAMQYEVFRVTKIKKGFSSNKQQERLLGIDSDRISNQAPEDAVQNRSTFRKAFDGVRSGVMGNTNAKDGVKKGYWLMSDLVEATQDAERNKQFILTFRDGADPTKQKSLTYRYEAETPKLAKQIVAKLTRLLELYNR